MDENKKASNEALINRGFQHKLEYMNLRTTKTTERLNTIDTTIIEIVVIEWKMRTIIENRRTEKER